MADSETTQYNETQTNTLIEITVGEICLSRNNVMVSTELLQQKVVPV